MYIVIFFHKDHDEIYDIVICARKQ